MAAVEQTIGSKAIEPEQAKIAEALNREVVPVVRRIRSVLNAELRSSATTIGDGVTLVYDVTHELNTADVMVVVYSLATGQDMISGTDYVADRVDTSTVRLTYTVAPTSDRVLIRV